MKKEEFLKSLQYQLKPMSPAEKEDVLYDYEEHIRTAMENGMTEETAVASIGSPREIARELLADYYIHQAEENTTVKAVLRAVFATVSLGLFNLIVLAGPFFAVAAVLIALGASAIAIMFSPIAALFGILIGTTWSSFSSGWMTLFAMMATEGVGILLLIATYYLSKWFVKGTMHYLRLNVKIVKGEK